MRAITIVSGILFAAVLFLSPVAGNAQACNDKCEAAYAACNKACKSKNTNCFTKCLNERNSCQVACK